MRNLINVVLFVLVLFGSAVPASAQSEVGGMTADVWAIMGVGAVLLGVILATWMASRADNRAAHKEIGENIKGVEKKIGENIKRVEDKVDDGFKVVNADIKGLNRSVGQLEGSLRRDLPGQRDGFMGS